MILLKTGHTNPSHDNIVFLELYISYHISTGGGSESKGHYPQWKRVTLDIDRYSSLPDSVGKLYAACADKKTGAWLSNLESSGWLSMVEAVLRASLTIVDYLETEGVYF